MESYGRNEDGVRILRKLHSQIQGKSDDQCVKSDLVRMMKMYSQLTSKLLDKLWALKIQYPEKMNNALKSC